MKKLLTSLIALAFAGLLGVAYAADEGGPPPAGANGEPKASTPATVKKTTKPRKKTKKQIHKQTSPAPAAAPAEPAK